VHHSTAREIPTIIAHNSRRVPGGAPTPLAAWLRSVVVCGLSAPILPDGSRWWPPSVGGADGRLVDGSMVGGGLLLPMRAISGRQRGGLLFCLIMVVALGSSSAKVGPSSSARNAEFRKALPASVIVHIMPGVC
jgi:hypothetical protein